MPQPITAPVPVQEPKPEPDEEAQEEEPKPTPAPPEPTTQPPPPPAQIAAANPITLGHYWPNANINWETTITDPSDIAQIEQLLRERHPARMESPLLGGIMPHLEITLDGVVTRFTLTSHQFPDRYSERIIIFQDSPNRGTYTVNHRLNEILSRHSDLLAEGGVHTIQPIPALPQQEGEVAIDSKPLTDEELLALMQHYLENPPHTEEMPYYIIP